MHRIRLLVLAGLVAAATVAGCSQPGSTEPPRSSAGGSAPVSASPPTVTPPPSAPSPEPAAMASGGPGSASNEAPVATLVTAAGSHAGTVGGFDFGTYSQSAPWLPATALERVQVPVGEALRVELDDRASVVEWTAAYAAADDLTGDRLEELGSGGATVAFDAPRAGDWVVTVTIVYGDGLGSGAYYWHVVAG